MRAPAVVRTALVALIAAAAGSALLLAAAPEAAEAAGCKKVRVGQLKIKKIKVRGGVGCRAGRSVAKVWMKRGYDDLNPISREGNHWFCTWRRRAPRSTTRGTAECDADPGEEIDFAVRRRR